MLMAPAHAAIAEVLETVDMRPPSPADSLSSRAPTPPPPPPPEVDLEALFGEEEDDEALAPAATFSPLKHSRAQDWDEVYDYSNDGQVPAALPPVVRPRRQSRASTALGGQARTTRAVSRHHLQ